MFTFTFTAALFTCINATTSPEASLQANKDAKCPTAVQVTPEDILSTPGKMIQHQENKSSSFDSLFTSKINLSNLSSYL